MDIENFTTINEFTYRAILMLIQGITLIVGLASVMFMLIAMICAVCDCLRKMGESVVRPLKPATDAHGYEKSGRLGRFECAADRRSSSDERSSIDLRSGKTNITASAGKVL